ncbi:MAG: hypothetical protein MZU79_02625 [Anaerotruncus sp.]|nr:hypothetical protein [Anaerotruncus sp.]
MFGESVLNTDYTMPVAETASIFCETIVNQAALRDASSKEETLGLLKSSLQDATQVIVDILSRFYFEQSRVRRPEEDRLRRTRAQTIDARRASENLRRWA